MSRAKGAAGTDRTAVVACFSESAFLTLLVCAVEGFPSKYQGRRRPAYAWPEGEVFGLLFGQRLRRNGGTVVANVTLAIPARTLCYCDEEGIVWSRRHEERIREMTAAYPTLEYLGTFHSHPWRRGEWRDADAAMFSEEDERLSLRNRESTLAVILGLTWMARNTGRERPDWLADHLIRGRFGRYKYLLATYALDHAEGRLSPTDGILCPAAMGIWNRDLIVEAPRATRKPATRAAARTPRG